MIVPRLFEPFLDRSDSSATMPQSVSLGLAVSRELARRMGGRLTYRRHDDRTIFTLELPATPHATAKSATVPSHLLSRHPRPTRPTHSIDPGSGPLAAIGVTCDATILATTASLLLRTGIWACCSRVMEPKRDPHRWLVVGDLVLGAVALSRPRGVGVPLWTLVGF